MNRDLNAGEKTRKGKQTHIARSNNKHSQKEFGTGWSVVYGEKRTQDEGEPANNTLALTNISVQETRKLPTSCSCSSSARWCLFLQLATSFGGAQLIRARVETEGAELPWRYGGHLSLRSMGTERLLKFPSWQEA